MDGDGELVRLVEAGQEIGDSATVSVIESSGPSGDPPLLHGLPITGFEASIALAMGVGLAALGCAVLRCARERRTNRSAPCP